MRPRIVAMAVLACATCAVCAACGGSTHTVTIDDISFAGVSKRVSGPLTAYRVPSGAMLPSLPIGAGILVRARPGAVTVGEVIVFHPPQGAANVLDACGNAMQGFTDAGGPRSEPCDQPTRTESDETFIKRVVGLAGDTLQITQGHVIRNGVPEKAPYIRACGRSPECTFRRSFTVPAGDVYLLGDNRGESFDSRYWGPEPEQWIIGPVVACTKGTRYCTGA
jgi:signal peptidase I